MPERTAPVPLGWFALTSSTAAATAFGLLAAHGAGLRGTRLDLSPDPGLFSDLGRLFTALAWTSTTPPITAATWTYAGLAALVLTTACLTRGFHTTPRPAELLLRATAIGSSAPLLLALLPFAAAYALWFLHWFLTGFGTCVQPECTAVPAVP
ncbi:MAG TPA: hypothetical protein VNO31_05840 [Umezawaea sp.]|nr:hypothetical protein [Umezawaea sp.]